MAKIAFHFGELFSRVGFIVTNLETESRVMMPFYNKRGTVEQYIKECKHAVKTTQLSCHAFRSNEVRLWLSVIQLQGYRAGKDQPKGNWMYTEGQSTARMEISAYMEEPFRLAIIGCGQIVMQSHLPAALASTRVRVVALVDPDVQRARKLAHTFGLDVSVTAHVSEVTSEIQGAIIATPNHTHCDLALQCIEARISVLIEKPLANSMADGIAIVNAAERCGVTVAVGYYSRFQENILLLGELLATGYFGTISRYLFRCGSVGGWAPVSGYNLDRRSAGGGVLVVTGAHFLDWMLHSFGYPDHIDYQDDSLGGPEANALAVFCYSSGMQGAIRLSKTVQMKLRHCLETDAGLVVLDPEDNTTILLRPRGDISLETRIRRKDAPRSNRGLFQLQLENFVEASQQGRQPLVSGKDGLLSIRLIEDMYAKRQPLNTEWYSKSEK